MGKALRNLSALLEKLYPWRWLLSVSVSLFALAIELLERRSTASPILAGGFLWQFLLLNLTLPILLGTSLSLLHLSARHSRAIARLNLQQVIRQHVSRARTWEDLAFALLQIPGTLLPVSASALTILNAKEGEVGLRTQWTTHGQRVRQILPSPTLPTCPLNIDVETCIQSGLFPCQCAIEQMASQDGNVYCLCLAHDTLRAGLMHIYTPAAISMRADQQELLAELRQEMSLALERFQLLRSDAAQTERLRGERQRLARHLHDTLAHDLAYLHLKLEQILLDDSLAQLPSIQGEVGRMHEVVTHSYEEVRRSLTELLEKPVKNLASEIQEFAHRLAERAGWKVDVIIEGELQSLPADISYQILLIVKEALRNVDKHAQAQRVVVEISRKNDVLETTVCDDGQGFNPQLLEHAYDNHGIELMKSLVAEMEGTFSIKSRHNGGTQIHIQLPLVGGVKPI